jgi:hypothetical protein
MSSYPAIGVIVLVMRAVSTVIPPALVAIPVLEPGW